MIRKLLAVTLAALALTATLAAPAEAGRDTTWGTVHDTGR